jgi:sialate O-acetylesterase
MNYIKINLLLIIIALCVLSATGQNYELEISLKGNWRFSIGDNIEWAEPGFNDSDWDLLKVPGKWEEQGYQGYDGFAWYRTEIEIPQSFEGRELFIELGYIDDVDEVYINGIKIGQTGSFPPDFATAYNSFRKYQLPFNAIKIGENNTIALRVYDAQLEGGIVRGNLRIAATRVAVIPDIILNGYWDFTLGQKAEPGKHRIMVPGAWEDNGFRNYDGHAVYSKTVNIPKEMANKKLIFMAGRIDDDDRLYINGQFIAETGDFYGRYNSDMHLEFRNYFIPKGIIKPGDNFVEIKVIDRMGEGGILEGNIGFISQENFIKYWRKRRK